MIYMISDHIWFKLNTKTAHLKKTNAIPINTTSNILVRSTNYVNVIFHNVIQRSSVKFIHFSHRYTYTHKKYSFSVKITKNLN